MPTSNQRAFGQSTTRPRRVAVPAKIAAALVPIVPETPLPAITSEPVPEPVILAETAPALPGQGSPETLPILLAEQNLPEEPVNYPPFAPCYSDALAGLPPSILRSLEDRLSRKKYDLAVDDEAVHAAIEKTRAAYLKKREAGRVRSAKARAEKKTAAAAPELAPPGNSSETTEE